MENNTPMPVIPTDAQTTNTRALAFHVPTWVLSPSGDVVRENDDERLRARRVLRTLVVMLTMVLAMALLY
jgi:hypothetical protein